MARPGPLDNVRSLLADELSKEQLAALPRRYFRVGDVLLVDAPLPEPEAAVADAYARTLRMRSVLVREEGVEGEFRTPRTRLAWGDPNTETVHTEMGVRFRLDPAKVMWSPGNLAERQRLASWDLAGETVVDLFAGIGYLCLPLAVHARPRRLVAIEKSPTTHSFLVHNVALNGVGSIVEPVLGDCRAVAPHAVADRVLMGLLPDSIEFLDVALRALKPSGGVLHVHRVARARTYESSLEELSVRLRELGARPQHESTHVVKSYGPGRDHIVLDVRVTR